MKLSRWIGTVLLCMGLVGCGGGGGSPGANGNLSDPESGEASANVDPIVRAFLQDALGSETTSISASGFTVLLVTLTDPSGRGIPNQVVTVTGDETKVLFPEGNAALTNALGVATIKVVRASLFAIGSDSLTVTYNYRAGTLKFYSDGSLPPSVDTVVARYVGYQLSAANVSLTNLNLGAPKLAAYGSRQISVQVNANGTPATSTPVRVGFAATCGIVTPAIASTNSQGVVQVTFSAINPAVTNDQGCSGSTVTIVASSTGVNPVNGNIAVDLAPATNLMFVEAKPSRIYLVGSGGVTQSIVKFKLINALNAAIQGQNVILELRDLAEGIPKTSFGTVGNIDAITLPTDANGLVSVPVFSGTVPTNVSVTASLVSDANISTTSAVLAVASGRAVQSRASLSVQAFAIEGNDIDGVSTKVIMSLADRQGNPVPDGTAINFVTEGGVMIPPTCTTGAIAGDSQCSVTVRSQNPRPADGLVSILAYAAGEENFVDLNFDNVYTLGEPFTDLGNAFRDDAALSAGISGLWVDGYFSVPRAGSASCTSFLGRSGSCDSVWGAADVRQQAVVVFATSRAKITSGSLIATAPIMGSNPMTNGLSEINVVIADLKGNSMPMGTTVEFSTDDATSVPGFFGALCRVTGTSRYTIYNSVDPQSFLVNLAYCADGDNIKVNVSSPSGTITEKIFTVTN